MVNAMDEQDMPVHKESHIPGGAESLMMQTMDITTLGPESVLMSSE